MRESRQQEETEVDEKPEISTTQNGQSIEAKATGSDGIQTGNGVAAPGNDAVENGATEPRILQTYFIDKDDQSAQIQVYGCFLSCFCAYWGNGFIPV